MANLWAVKKPSSQAEIRHLRAFVALARRLNFSRAADDLFLTQPALSRTIQDLERSLEASLFLRDNHQVALTEAGAALLTGATAVVEQFDLLMTRARFASNGTSGALRLGFYGPTFFNNDITSEAYAAFKRNFPDVHLEVTELFSAEIPALLRSHRIDVAVGRERYGAKDLVSHVLRMEPLVALLPRQHPLSGRSTIRFSDLRNDRLVTFSENVAPVFVERVREATSHAGLPQLVDLELNQLYSILAAITSDHLVGIITETSDPRDGRFVCVRFDDVRLSIPLVMTYLDGALPRPAATFVSMVLAAAREPAADVTA